MRLTTVHLLIDVTLSATMSVADYIVQDAGQISNEPNTVEAKSVEEIQKRLEKLEKEKGNK